MKKPIVKLAHLFSIACLCLFAVLIPAAVVARFIFNEPIGWIEPICAILLVLFTCATAVVATCERLHIAVRMPLPAGSWADRAAKVMVRLIVAITFGLSAYYASDLALETGGQSLPEVPELPASIMYWPIAASFALMLLAALEDMVLASRGEEQEETPLIGGLD